MPRSRWLIGAHQQFLVIGLAYGWSGLSMLLQPERWAGTTAYQGIFDAGAEVTWSVLFLAAAALLVFAAATCPRWPVVRILALVVTMALTTSWLGAFLLRWLSSDAPPATAISFVVYLYVLIRSARDHDEQSWTL